MSETLKEIANSVESLATRLGIMSNTMTKAADTIQNYAEYDEDITKEMASLAGALLHHDDDEVRELSGMVLSRYESE